MLSLSLSLSLSGRAEGKVVNEAHEALVHGAVSFRIFYIDGNIQYSVKTISQGVMRRSRFFFYSFHSDHRDSFQRSLFLTF